MSDEELTRAGAGEAAWSGGGSARVDQVAAEGPAREAQLSLRVAPSRALPLGVPDVVGRYRLLYPIGSGAMGEVYAAEHLVLGRPAAVKMLERRHVGNDELEQRFLDEARATAAARHPCTVEIYDFGYHGDGRAFIAMELLEGWTLGEQLREHGPLDLGTAMAITRQIAAALASAHAAGIVHRDLKPDNIFILSGSSSMFAVTPSACALGCQPWWIKLLDFGVAKHMGTTGYTQVGAMLGSPLYMSPEQCRGARGVDSRSDFYSLGCVIFDMLTGHPPFPATTLGDALTGHLSIEPPRLRDLDPRVPDEVDALVAVLLRKDPSGRCRRAIEVVEAIDRFRPIRH